MKINSECDMPLQTLLFKKYFPNHYIFQLSQVIFQSTQEVSPIITIALFLIKG